MDDLLIKLKKGKTINIQLFELCGKYHLEIDGLLVEKSSNPVNIIKKLKTL